MSEYETPTPPVDPELERLRQEEALLTDRLGGAARVAELSAARERVHKLRALAGAEPQTLDARLAAAAAAGDWKAHERANREKLAAVLSKSKNA